ncbi:proteasome activator complex subunit 4-like isoform X2 [Bombyx mandarina]|uniref:Proteasome activator complex subunit 4-like isoform X1 n=2 Tax=Bombyx mandarina TaxID=7092 RepID=A0A6J2K3Y8_BOMMA|nr:proteasome activator complex subunit 4-like isoform X1 [Bombyx mandarina]XP_028036647.1 proteasome activator complex subunit 4-like isoform X2 [Bombyx mandarina]
MIQDDEYELLVTTPERIKALGFKPQKEFLTNHLLPYASELDEESTRFLGQVKINLAKSVMLREMKPACGVWLSRLMKYIRIYGLKFSKADHIDLIKLAYELIIIPDLEPSKVHKFSTMFIMLTKKRQLISPEELKLPWRPLYDLGQRIFDKNALHVGMFHYIRPDRSGKQGFDVFDLIRKLLSGHGVEDALHLFGLSISDKSELPTSLESSYVALVKCARPYFELSATKEILDLLLPRINPWTADSYVLSQLVVFLPVALHPRNSALGHELWFEKLMVLWDTCYNAQCGVWDLMIIFTGLAKRNPGVINWSQYAPRIFSRFLHALNLPVSYKDMQINNHYTLDTKHMASWIVWSICPDGVVLKHLRCFMGGVESYLHSANSGRWSYKLRDFLKKLTKEFLNRYRRETEHKFKESWENQVPEHYKLREEDITEFINIVLEPTLQALYNRVDSLEVSFALQNLATLRPAIVIPPLLEKFKTSLNSLTEPHRVTAAMSGLAAVARPMVRGPDAGYSEGPTHIVHILMAVLPGLDPNDIKKTLVSLHFILFFSWMVPLIDCSSAHEYWPDLTEEELLTCESTAQIEDFVLVFFEKIFSIVESSVLEHVRLDTKESDGMRSKADAVMEAALSSATTAVLMQCSPKIFKEALRKFKSFATQTTFETNVSGSMVGVLLRVFARVDPESTLAAFLPLLCDELDELLASDDALKEENPPRDLMYRLVLLMHLVECDGTVLLKYVPRIIPVLDRALKIQTYYALNRASEILAHMLISFNCIELKEWKSSTKDYSAAPQTWLPVREWGHGCKLKDLSFKWHVPCKEEAECAQMLLDRYMKPEISKLKQWVNGDCEMSREERCRCFYVLVAVLSCGNFLPQPNEEPVLLLETQVPSTSIPYTNGVKFSITLDGENVRVAVTRLLVRVQERMLADKSDDTRGLELLTKVWERVVVMKGSRVGPSLEERLISYGALDRVLDGRAGPTNRFGGAGTSRLRMLTAEAARIHDESRVNLVCEAGITPIALKALHALAELSVNTYTSVRMLSQIRLYWMLNHYPYSYRTLVPKLAELLIKGGEGDEWHARHKGTLYMMLGPRNAPLIAKQDWEVARTLWPAILKAPLSEKPSILKLEQAFGDTIHRNFPAVNTRLVIPQSAIDAAARLLTEEQLNDAEFVEMLKKAKQNETAFSDRNERLYNELILELVDLAETPNIPWRRLELAFNMAVYCPSLQTAYPARAVRLAARGLLHDDVAVRRSAQRLAHYALKQRKRPLHKIHVDPYELAGLPRPAQHIPGYRKDVEWVMWSEDRIPKNDEEWDRPWLRSPSFGFYQWPEKLVVAAPISQQTCCKFPPPECMEEGERYLFEFFDDDENVNKLVSFLTVEEKKGKDKFSGVRFLFFKFLFAHFGPRIADKFTAHALRCAAETREAPQRFAAEVASAALRAARYWTRDDALKMYSDTLEIFKAGLTSVTPETMNDWGTALATGMEKMDPLRGATVVQGIVDLAIPPPAPANADPDQKASFVVCARLHALQGAIGSLKWRTASLSQILLKKLDAANFIQHPYQNVRESVGSLLATMFDTEVLFPGGPTGYSLSLGDFIESIQPRLAPLYDENGDIVISLTTTTSPLQATAAEEAPQSAASTSRTRNSLSGQIPVRVARLSPDSAEASVSEDAAQSEAVEGEEESIGRSRLEKQLVDRLDAALSLSGDAPVVAPQPKDHARALSLLTTVIRASTGVCVRGVSAGGVGGGVVRAACRCAARGPTQPHDELPRAAAALLAALAVQTRTAAGFDRTCDELELLATGNSWWARLACLDFAQPFLFYGLPFLCDSPDRAVRAEQFALKLMRDSRLEVRQSAAKLLTGLMHCRALPDEQRTLRLLIRSARSKQLVERHFGVLGMCAYLSSRPYSIGSKFGDVLSELSRHTNAPDPVPATIRRALADFRRTHQDDWPKHRDQLSEDELDMLADLTSPPSYFA